MKKLKCTVKLISYNLKCANLRNNNLVKIKKTRFRLYATKKVGKNIWHKNLWLILCGGLIGLINGFFGGGGGMIAVPVLERVLKLDSKHAHATAIFVIFPLSIISASIYVVNGYIKTLPLIYVTIGVIFGGILGAFILKYLPSKIVRIIFAIIMLIGGIKLIIWASF